MRMAIMTAIAVGNALFTAMVAIRMATIMMKRSLRSALFLVLRPSLALSCSMCFFAAFSSLCCNVRVMLIMSIMLWVSDSDHGY